MSKNQNYVFCIDSDGCAMDTMTYKHQLFFGPLAVRIFEIRNGDEFLKKWDNINLYSRTRGVNRFVGLVMALEESGIQNIDRLKQWVSRSTSLSNDFLKEEITKNASDDLTKALAWSNAVNQHIRDYEGQTLSFKGVREGLAVLHELGNVYVVSSANKEAVQDEWIEQDLIHYADDLYCQDRGKKEDIIAELIHQGYQPDKIMMVGDSPGDLDAAEQNQVVFFPILVGKEMESWQCLKERVAKAFTLNNLSKKEVDNWKQEFWENLD
ncbi:HAD family hydrolase [Streptococcus pluranimalium]